MTRRVPLVLLVLAAACAAAPSAHAATPFTVGTGIAPEIAVTPNGTAHVAWLIPDQGSTPGKIGWCRIPAGASACDKTYEIALPDRVGATEKIGSTITITAFSDTKIELVTDCYDCWPGASVTAQVSRWTTTNGAATVPAANPLLGRTPTTTGISGPGTMIEAGPFIGPIGARVIARPGAADGDEAATATGTSFVYDPSVVRVPGQNELVYAVNDLGVVKYAVFPGPDALTAANINDDTKWVIDQTLPGAEPDSSLTRLSAGPNGVGLTYRVSVPGDDRAVLRRYDAATNSFGAPVTLDGPGEATVQELASSQDPGGRFHVVWRNLFDTKRLRYVRSDATGSTFTAAANIAQGEDFQDPEVGAGSDGNGYAVWHGNGNTPIRVVRLEPYPEPGATPPPPAGPPAPPAPRAPAIAPVGRSVRSSVPGASIDFGLPKGCVQPGQTFRVTLKWKRKKKKGNKFVKVTRADFYVGSKVVKKDRKAPFVQTLQVTASARRGSTISVRARAFIKVRKGKAPKKSIRATVKVCP